MYVIASLNFQAVLGKIVKRPALLNKKLIRELKALASPEDPYSIVTGKTMCANDFYEGTAIHITDIYHVYASYNTSTVYTFNTHRRLAKNELGRSRDSFFNEIFNLHF